MGAAQNYGTVTKQRLQRNGLINGVRAYKVEGLPDRNFDLTRKNTCKPNNRYTMVVRVSETKFS